MNKVIDKVKSFIFPYSGTSSMTIQYKKPLKAESQDQTLAWVTKIDITPPPGLPNAGHSIYSSLSQGFRNKLMARIVYIKPKQGRPVALVQCDLLTGSNMLHHKVAELIADKTDIDAGGLAICATHTHSGPGNYMGNKFYNDSASNVRGFIEPYFQFLSERMATAIINAYTNRKPSRIATGTTLVENVTKNRSLPAYLMNKNIQEKIKIRPRRQEAIDPRFHMIRVDCADENGDYHPIGAFTNFSNHPNSRPSELENFFHGDVTAFSERVLEQHIKRHYDTPWEPVHAAANYNHGDCNPNHDEELVENFVDIKALGTIIGNKAFNLFRQLDDKLKDDVIVRYRAKEINLLEENSIDHIQLAKRPAMGMAAAAGALGRGRESFLTNVPWFKAGQPRKLFFYEPDHKQKRVAFGPLQRLVYKKDDYPHRFMGQIIQVDDHVLLPLPWEVTQEIGQRIADYVKEKAEASGLTGVREYIVTDVSNGFLGYVTTPEEYSLQYYEGGSNQYGPNTGDFIKVFLGKEIEKLIKEGTATVLPSQLRIQLPKTDLFPKGITAQGQRNVKQHPIYFESKNWEEPYWVFQWDDVLPDQIEFHNSLVQIQVSDDNQNWTLLMDDGILVDDAGMDISVRYLNEMDDTNMGIYETRWHNPKTTNGRKYRFTILPRKGQDLFHSPAFQG